VLHDATDVDLLLENLKIWTLYPEFGRKKKFAVEMEGGGGG
jgi:hypothetical protein